MYVTCKICLGASTIFSPPEGLLCCSISWSGQFKIYFCPGVLGNPSVSSTVSTSWKPQFQTSLLGWKSSHSDESVKASVCTSNHGHVACVSAVLPLVNASFPGRHGVRLLLLPQRRDKATRSGPPAVWNRLTPLFLSVRLPLDTIATGRNRTVLFYLCLQLHLPENLLLVCVLFSCSRVVVRIQKVFLVLGPPV